MVSDAIIWKLRSTLNRGRVTDYYTGSGSPSARALLVHNPEPYLMNRDSLFFRRHQNNRNSRLIGDFLCELGYEVDVVSQFDSNPSVDGLGRYDLLFGKGPAFEQLVTQVPKHVPRVYYVSGIHPSEHSKHVNQRAERLAERRGVTMETREFQSIQAIDFADAVVMGGDEKNALTYQKHCKDDLPVYPIRLSFFEDLEPVPDRDFKESRTNFLWFGGGDFLTKGLDLAIEAVVDGPDEWDLYVCGPLDQNEKFIDIYHDELYGDDTGIHPVGWVHVYSEQFRRLTERCAFMLYPPIEIGHPSGGMANPMFRGVVPISTLVRPSETQWGIRIDDDSIPAIRETAARAASLSPDRIAKLSREASRAANEEFTAEYFRECFTDAVRDIVHEKDVDAAI